MSKKSNWFVVATEGATTDGRKIERNWLSQIAEDYDPKKYGARINLEHFRWRYFDKEDAHSYSYGDVLAVKTQETEDGKLQLLAQIEPTDKLVELVKQKQKVYTSIEVDTTFANTDRAYLVGLAVTDSPASLGTEYLSFCAGAKANPLSERKQKAENLFTAAIETELEFEEVKEKGLSVFAKIRALFADKEKTDDERFTDHQKYIELLAEQTQKTLEKLTALSADLAKQQTELTEMKATNESIQAKFTTLEKTPSADFGKRPIIAGEGKSEFLTDC